MSPPPPDRPTTAPDPRLERFETPRWDAAVVGLGYVGLPLLVTMARAGIDVTGYDVDPSVVDGLSAARSHVDDVTDDDLTEIKSHTTFTRHAGALKERDVLFICVPTPLAIGKQPDISHIEHAVDEIATILRPGHLVILESTTYPGTTENMVLPKLEATGLRLDADFLLGYSPERVDPGNTSFRTSNIPRIVGGASDRSTRAIELVYRRFVDEVFPVTNARTAEMAKLLENTFRWVNIALVNELSSVARAIGVDIWELIEAAATKPFGYMPFYPGPGVGGHCIPLDPFYLQFAGRIAGEGTRFIELAETINSRMPSLVVRMVQDALNERGRALRGSHVLALGVAYKPNVSDYRESPALDVIAGLQHAGAVVSYADPLVPAIDAKGITLEATPLHEDALAAADCVLVLCDHDAFDYELAATAARLIVDTRNGFARRGVKSANLRSL